MKKFTKIFAFFLAVIMSIGATSATAYAVESKKESELQPCASITDDLIYSRNFHNPLRRPIRCWYDYCHRDDDSESEHHVYALISLRDKSDELPYGRLIEPLVVRCSSDVLEVRTIYDFAGSRSGYWVLIKDHFYSDSDELDLGLDDYLYDPYVRYASLENAIDFGEQDQQVEMTDLMPQLEQPQQPDPQPEIQLPQPEVPQPDNQLPELQLPENQLPDAQLPEPQLPESQPETAQYTLQVDLFLPEEYHENPVPIDPYLVVKPEYSILGSSYIEDVTGYHNGNIVSIATIVKDVSAPLDPATFLYPEYAIGASIEDYFVLN